MALPILDGNQSATTLSTILSSGQHITAHTVVSLGTQAITDMRGAVSGSVVSISNFPASQVISGTVTANPTGTQTIAGTVTANVSTNTNFPISYRDELGDQLVVNTTGQSLPVQVFSPDGGSALFQNSLPISGTVSVGNSVTIGSLPLIAGTVTANLNQPNFVGANGDIVNYAVQIGYFDDGYGEFRGVNSADSPLPITLTNPASVNSLPAIPAGTNRIGVVTIGGGTVTIGAGTSQIGSVTAFLTYSQTAVSLSSTAATAIPIVFPTNGVYGGSLQGYNGTNTYIYSGIQAIGSTSLASATSLPVSLGSLPALVAGTAQIGSVTASISNSVVTFYPLQGTAVSNTNFTSTTASTTLVSAVANREVLTVFNEGAGNLHISPGATCTTVAYQVRLSAGDYWECPAGQLSLAHTAVFATAGTARVTQIS